MSEHVFISYSHSDQSIVDRVILQVQQQGIHSWRDHESIAVGTPDWEQAIRRGISSAVAVIYVASESSAQSQYVRHELLIARDNNIAIFPLWIRGNRWSECVPMGYAHIQFADGRSNLANAVQEIVRQITVRRSIKSIVVFSSFVDDVSIETGEEHDVWRLKFSDVLSEEGFTVGISNEGTWTWGDGRRLLEKYSPSLVVIALNRATAFSMKEFLGYASSSRFKATIRKYPGVILARVDDFPALSGLNLDMPMVEIMGIDGRFDAIRLLDWIRSKGRG